MGRVRVWGEWCLYPYPFLACLPHTHFFPIFHTHQLSTQSQARSPDRLGKSTTTYRLSQSLWVHYQIITNNAILYWSHSPFLNLNKLQSEINHNFSDQFTLPKCMYWTFLIFQNICNVLFYTSAQWIALMLANQLKRTSEQN